MANSDFRVAADFLDHPKTIKLLSVCEAAGVLALLRLWGFAAKYRPRGLLSKMTDRDIEIAAKWDGEPGQFVSGAVSAGFLDKRKNGQYSLHNWKKRNEFAYHAPERSQKAKIAAKAKHTKGHNDLRSAKTKIEQCSEHAKRTAPSPSPSPIPSPSPNSISSTKSTDSQSNPDIKRFIDHWHDEYSKAGLGKYLVTPGKDGAQVKRLLGSISLKEAMELATWFVNYRGGDFVGRLNRTISVFVSQYNAIRQAKTMPTGSKAVLDRMAKERGWDDE